MKTQQPSPSIHVGILYPLTLTLAFCSIVYELLLAQTLAATMGATFLRYNTTIGIYLASLGFGAILCSRPEEENSALRLADVELLLALAGSLSPLLVILWDAAVFRGSVLLKYSFRGPLYETLIYGFNYGLIAFIGVLSGFELPLLMHLGKQGEIDRSNHVLAVDYFGTLLGAVAFPFLLLPRLGIITAANVIGFLSGVCGLAILLNAGRRGRNSRLWPYLAVTTLCLFLVVEREPLHRIVTERIYFWN